MGFKVNRRRRRTVEHLLHRSDPSLLGRPGANNPLGQGVQVFRGNHRKAARQGFERHQRLTLVAGRQEQDRR